MAAMSGRRHPGALHPLNAILLSFPFPLFLSALLTDLAYRASFQVQWINFSSWLIAGGLLVGAFVLLWAVLELFRSRTTHRGGALVYFVVLLATWVLGFVNALVHGMDAWASMPAGLYLSALAALLAFAAAWIGYSGFHAGDVR
jgi:uncharacterized membrane protein